MSTSFGEKEILYNSFIVGKATVRTFHAAQAIFPRLTMMIGVSLYDVSDEEHAPKDIKRPYVMADITGELRLKEMQDIVAPVVWTGEKHFIKATKRGSESQVMMACDLDFPRVELIERWRDGKPPLFWLQLWPMLMASGERLEWPECRAFEVKITREAWMGFYSQVGGGTFDVIEFRFSPKEAGRFRAAVQEVQKAREQIAHGDYDGAVLTCRKATEQIFRELPDGESDDIEKSETKDSPIQKFFRASTDPDRAAAYIGILSRLKALSAIAAHGVGAKVIFSRDEAQFVLATTESLIALVGRLASRKFQ
jgi:hypothetical protein